MRRMKNSFPKNNPLDPDWRCRLCFSLRRYKYLRLPGTTGAPCTYHRISDAAKENSVSRMLVGTHFRLACEMGYEQGADVGAWVVMHASRLYGY